MIANVNKCSLLGEMKHSRDPLTFTFPQRSSEPVQSTKNLRPGGGLHGGKRGG